MTRDQFQNAQYSVSFTAGMNQRYHQRLATYWARWNRGVKISVGLLAVASLVISFATPVSQWWYIISICVAAVAAVAAICLNVIPLEEWQRNHLDLFRRWTDLREEIDVLAISHNGKVRDEVLGRLQFLESKLHRICGTEPHFHLETLKQCEIEERASRGEEKPDTAA